MELAREPENLTIVSASIKFTVALDFVPFPYEMMRTLAIATFRCKMTCFDGAMPLSAGFS